ncbi:hypothetical protein [Serratia marcescens]|uniref:hypothetical protein n=2 Tax=Serratia TaxID=613 RepID=UPI001EF8E208|nr:hypothetical protein [Serratia marcescens]
MPNIEDNGPMTTYARISAILRVTSPTLMLAGSISVQTYHAAGLAGLSMTAGLCETLFRYGCRTGSFGLSSIDESKCTQVAEYCSETRAELCHSLNFLGDALITFADNDVCESTPESLCQLEHELTAISLHLSMLTDMQRRTSPPLINSCRYLQRQLLAVSSTGRRPTLFSAGRIRKNYHTFPII